MPASVKDYFETEPGSRTRSSQSLSVNWSYPLQIDGLQTGRKWELESKQRLHFDFDANAIFVTVLVPTPPPGLDIVQLCQQLVHNFAGNPLFRAPPVFIENAINLRVNTMDRFHSTRRLVDTRQIILYVDAKLNDHQKSPIYAYGDSLGMLVKIRDQQYALAAEEKEKPLAFICHDSRDKDLIARPLAQELTRILGQVWFDEYSLKVGDSLREKIEFGLKECKRCIVVITPHFLANTGWTKVEFNSVFSRELIERRNVVLPIWHDVSKEGVYDYSPSLVNRFAAQWSDGVERVARQVREAILSVD